jgi:hypothetical protein
VSARVERPYYGSLLDLRTHGWVLDQSWPGLFDLYVKDGEARAELSPELNDIQNALTRGRSIDDHDTGRLESALFMSCVLRRIEEGAGDSFAIDYWRQYVGNEVAGVLGPVVEKILAAKTSRRAELAARGLVNVMKRAAKGFVRMKFPRPTRGNARDKGWCTPKALLVIEHARVLCEELRRLPTKGEVRRSLEMAGFGYGNSKGIKNLWNSLFVRAGLSGLPD